MQEKAGLPDNAGTVKISYDVRRYWARKSNQLCVSCGKANDSGKILCPQCSERRHMEDKQDRVFREGLGLCNRCGKNRVFGGEKRCPECRAKANRNAARRGRTDGERKKNNDSCRLRYHEYAARGICVKCGRRRAVPGKRRCGICAHRRADQDRQRRGTSGMARAERCGYGLCYTCGSILDMDNVKLCSRCYAALEKAREARGNVSESQWGRGKRVIFRSRQSCDCDPITENAKRIFRTAPYAGAFIE